MKYGYRIGVQQCLSDCVCHTYWSNSGVTAHRYDPSDTSCEAGELPPGHVTNYAQVCGIQEPNRNLNPQLCTDCIGIQEHAPLLDL